MTTADLTTAGDPDLIRRAVSSVGRPEPAGRLSTTLTFGWRGMLKVRHVPEQLIDSTVTPVMFLLLFTYLFGGAISGSTSEYLDYVFPGMLAMTVLFNTVYSGVTINTDMTKGVVDRFRSLPIWRPAPLAGALLGDSVRYLGGGTVMTVLALALGYRPDAGLLGVVGALALVTTFAFGLSWVFTTVGLCLRAPNAVMTVGFTTIFPLTFVSNVFVAPDTLPGWLEAFVAVNPVTVLADATRSILEGNPDATDILVSLGVAAGLTAVFLPMTTRLYHRG